MKKIENFKVEENPLFLNFNRPVGRKIFKSGTGITAPQSVSYIHQFLEICIPNNGDSDVAGLTAMSNSIFIEARMHNMSLAPYGHNDPVKFCLAAIYPVLLLTEIRRDLAIASHFEFGNTAANELLSAAADFDLEDAMSDYSNIAKKFNALVDRVNNLYIPSLEIMNRWLPHRKYVYRDDEGDRYQYYLYNLAAYYELDLDPLSATVGQLICKPLANGTRETLTAKLSRVSGILDSLESDEDFVEFATEAIKAGMNRIILDKIPGSADAFAEIPFESVYSLDDIMSHENAGMVLPILKAKNASFYNGRTTWNIVEDTRTNKLIVGESPTSTSLSAEYGTLPCVSFRYIKEQNEDAEFASDTEPYLTFNERPITTHAKVKSSEGLRSLTRYIIEAWAATTKQVTEATLMDYMAAGSWNPKLVSAKQNLWSVNSSDTIGISTLRVYGESVLTGHLVFSFADSFHAITMIGKLISEAIPVYYHQCLATDVSKYIDATIGFKVKTNLMVAPVNGQIYPYFKFVNQDYDYITFIQRDTLITYFAKQLWNDLHMMSVDDSKHEKGHKEEKPKDQ